MRVPHRSILIRFLPDTDIMMRIAIFKRKKGKKESHIQNTEADLSSFSGKY